jgi:hypothetical protein
MIGWPRVAILAIAITIGSVYYFCTRGSLAQFTTNDTPAQPYRSNERIIVEKDGSKTLLARWAIGSPKTITTLRIPLAFTTVFGAPFGSNYKDPDYQQPFLRTLLFDAVLPNFSPVDRKHRMMTSDEEDQVIHVLLTSNIGLRIGRNEYDALHSRAKSRYESLPIYGYPTVDKPDRFDLRCVGPAHNRSGQAAIVLRDFCFSGLNPLSADDFMTCTILEVPTREEQPNFPGRPSCWHWFVVPGLTAVAKASYSRQHQRDWRQLKERTIRWLESFRAN